MSLYTVALAARKAAKSSHDLDSFITANYAGKLVRSGKVDGTVVSASNAGFRGIEVTVRLASGKSTVFSADTLHLH